MVVAGDLFDKSTHDPTFLKKIVTGDESLVYVYTIYTRPRSVQAQYSR
jgi:hypothetical protein